MVLTARWLNRRHLAAVASIVALVATACAGPRPPSPTRTMTEAPSQTGGPGQVNPTPALDSASPIGGTAAPSPTEIELPFPWPIATLGTGTIHTVRFPPNFTDNRIESDGPLVVFSGPVPGDSQAPIWLANLTVGTLRQVYVPPEPVAIEEPVVSGDQVAWMESAGTSTWRVKTLYLNEGVPTTIATFRAPTQRAGVIRINGDTLAYVVPGQSGQGDTIVVRSSKTPFPTLRTVHIGDAVFKLGLTGASLFWDQGRVTPPPQLSIIDTSAWLSTAADPIPRKVADDAFELGFDGTWMTWVRDPSENGNGDQVMAMEVGQTTPIILSPEPEPNTPGGLFRSIWPSVGDAIAAWSVDWSQAASLTVIVWPIGSSTPVAISGTPGVAGTSIGSGWLDWNEGQAVGGARVSDILASIKAAGIH